MQPSKFPPPPPSTNNTQPSSEQEERGGAGGGGVGGGADEDITEEGIETASSINDNTVESAAVMRVLPFQHRHQASLFPQQNSGGNPGY